MTNRRAGKKDPFMETGKIGEFWATTAQLVKAFGSPTICNDHIPGGYMRQTLYEWRLRTRYGPLCVYDYKEWEYPNFASDKLICWQVGGRCEAYTSRIEHPGLKWLHEQLGVPVKDDRPWCYRPAVVAA